MVSDLHPVLRFLHIMLGFGGFLAGALAILLPKFSRKSYWHRWIGRAYAVMMIGMTLISIPLAIWGGSIFLLVIGLLTLTWVGGGWLALRTVRARAGGKRIAPSNRLRLHVMLMGSSYIAAWTAFLVNVHPLGAGFFWMGVYSIGPTLLGSFLISRSIARLTNPRRDSAEQSAFDAS